MSDEKGPLVSKPRERILQKLREGNTCAAREKAAGASALQHEADQLDDPEAVLQVVLDAIADLPREASVPSDTRVPATGR